MMTVTSVTPTTHHGLTAHLLTFSTGITGVVADASHLTPGAFPGAAKFTGVTLMHGPKFGLVTMPHGWVPTVGATVPVPPKWRM